MFSHQRSGLFCRKGVRAPWVVAWEDIFCCKTYGWRKWKLETVWENADELCLYVWFAGSSCAWRIPLAHPEDWLLCEATCTSVQSRQAQYATSSPPPEKGGHWTLRQVAIFAHLKYTHLANWARGGLRDLGRPPLCSCGPEKDQTRKFCDWRWVGVLLPGGCLAVLTLLYLEGGRGHICSKLQEADEVLICWEAVSLGPCSQ